MERSATPAPSAWSIHSGERRRLARALPFIALTLKRGMNNRVRQFFEESGGQDLPADYWTVETQCESFVVTREVARGVERALDQVSPDGWIVFSDLAGARQRIRARLIERVSECTAAQRATRRAFYRERDRETKADRDPWDDD